MAKTINDIEAALKRYEEEKSRLETEIQQLREHAQKLAIDAETAAVVGDVDKFRSLEATRNSVLTDIKFREIRLAKMAPAFGQEDILETWRSSCKGFEKEISRRSDVIESSRLNLAKSFADMVQLQNSMLQMKQRLEQIGGHELAMPATINDGNTGRTKCDVHTVSPLVALAMETLPADDPRRSYGFYEKILADIQPYYTGE